MLVFQHGIGKNLFGFTSTAGIYLVVPLLLFVILFGLSMDYHALRAGSARWSSASTHEAVAQGLESTAVVTSAALVMVAVFSVFIALSMLFFKQFGVGLAAAILIDAMIVRGVLLPASTKNAALETGTGTSPAGSSGCPSSRRVRGRGLAETSSNPVSG